MLLFSFAFNSRNEKKNQCFFYCYFYNVKHIRTYPQKKKKIQKKWTAYSCILPQFSVSIFEVRSCWYLAVLAGNHNQSITAVAIPREKSMFSPQFAVSCHSWCIVGPGVNLERHVLPKPLLAQQVPWEKCQDTWRKQALQRTVHGFNWNH